MTLGITKVLIGCDFVFLLLLDSHKLYKFPDIYQRII